MTDDIYNKFGKLQLLMKPRTPYEVTIDGSKLEYFDADIREWLSETLGVHYNKNGLVNRMRIANEIWKLINKG